MYSYRLVARAHIDKWIVYCAEMEQDEKSVSFLGGFASLKLNFGQRYSYHRSQV